MLAEIFQIRRLFDKPVDLSKHVELLVWLEVAPGKLLFNAGEDLKRPRILDLLRFGLVCGSDA
jgi:hypothetical protein